MQVYGSKDMDHAPPDCWGLMSSQQLFLLLDNLFLLGYSITPWLLSVPVCAYFQQNTRFTRDRFERVCVGGLITVSTDFNDALCGDMGHTICIILYAMNHTAMDW